jgi:outer membrane protein
MKLNFDKFFLLITSILLLNAPLFANEVPEENPAGQEPTPGMDVVKDNFSWSLGIGFIASPRPYKGTDAKYFPVPVLNMRYKRFFLQGIRGGFDYIQKDKVTANVYAQVRFRGLEPDDSPFLEGMTERKKSMDAGTEFIYKGRPVGFRIGAVSDVLGRSNGQEVSFLAISGVPLGKLGIVLVGFGPRWLSTNRVDYYYGVSEDEARPDRPAYQGQDTWNLDLNVTTILNVSQKMSLFFLFNREGLGNGIKDSPLVDQSAAYSFVTSLTYKFR